MGEDEKVGFVRAMLRYFEKNIHSFPDVFLFVSDTELREIEKEHRIYSCSALWMKDDLYFFAVKNSASDCEGKSPSNLLLCCAVDVLTEELQYFARQWREDAWFYNSERSEQYTPESLAKSISDKLYDSVSILYTNALGLDFNALTSVAEMKYEKDAARGRIVLGPCCDPADLSKICTLQRCLKNEDDWEKSITLNVKNARLIRRLFAGSGEGGLLFVQNQNGEYSYHGYVKKESLNEMFTIIELDGKGGWTLCLSGQKVFSVKGNRIYWPPFPLAVMKSELERVLGAEYIDMLSALSALSEQKHGTSVVFMDLDVEHSCGAARMNNLVECGRAFKIEPINLREKGQERDFDVVELLKSISRVDGAIIVDYPSRSIRYTNAIVDGKAMPGGRPDAGARHNALHGFIETLKEELKGNTNERALAFVFSEDGDISSYSTIQ